MNKAILNQAGEMLSSWKSPLEIRVYVVLERSRLISKEGFMKKLDVSNRIKALHDLLCEALKIDDSFFTTNVSEKVISNNKDEQVIVVIIPKRMRGETRLYEALDKEGIIV